MTFGRLSRSLGLASTATVAVVGATVAAAGIAFPALLSTLGLPLALAGFAVNFVSTLAVSFSAPMFRQGLRPLQPVPPKLLNVLGAAALVGGVSAVIGLVRTRGFSADPSTSACDWPISTDHGSTVRCVSESRWLEVHNDVLTGILGVLVIHAAVMCAVIVKRTTDSRRVSLANGAASN